MVEMHVGVSSKASAAQAYLGIAKKGKRKPQPLNHKVTIRVVYLSVQIINMSSGLGSNSNLAANLKGEGEYQMAAKIGLAYRCSKAALCMREPLLCPQSARLAHEILCIV
jgi:hypothetical protein